MGRKIKAKMFLFTLIPDAAMKYHSWKCSSINKSWQILTCYVLSSRRNSYGKEALFNHLWVLFWKISYLQNKIIFSISSTSMLYKTYLNLINLVKITFLRQNFFKISSETYIKHNIKHLPKHWNKSSSRCHFYCSC